MIRTQSHNEINPKSKFVTEIEKNGSTKILEIRNECAFSENIIFNGHNLHNLDAILSGKCNSYWQIRIYLHWLEGILWLVLRNVLAAIGEH